MDYKIAGETLRLEGCGAGLTRLGGFAPFRLPDDAGRSVLCTVRTETPLTDWADGPAVETLDTFHVEDIACTFSRHPGGYAFRMEPPDGAKPVFLWQTHGSGVMQSNVAVDGEPDPTAMRFMLWMAFALAMLSVGGTPVHSSVIVCRERCVLFLGESGTGKSTHTRLWLRHIPGTHLLNDDSPIVRITDGAPVAFGSAWSGKTPVYLDEQYPLAAIVRLSQAPHNRISRLNRLAAFGALLPSCPPSFARDESLTDGLCRIISGIIATTPVYHLECLPDADAARLAYNTIFGDEDNS